MEPCSKDLYTRLLTAETSVEFDFLNENESLKNELKILRENLNLLNSTISDLQKHTSLLNTNINEILSSWSYRIGSAITKIIYFPIKLLKGDKK